MQNAPKPDAPRREIHHGDAIAWLTARARLDGASVITSLPDLAEVPTLGFDGWCRWFEDAAALTMSRVPDDGVAIFFQSDVRRDGAWIDKGALVTRAAERANMRMLFHTIVCRHPPGTITFGRASYSHLIGFSRVVRPPRSGRADVIADGGFQPGKKSMGVAACVAACRFVLAETTTRTIVDPFCGYGTVLAVANALGLHAIGVDVSSRMCKKARTLELDAL